MARFGGRGAALSLRLRAQTLSRTGRGWVAPAGLRPAFGRAKAALAMPGGRGAGAGEFYLSRYGRGGEPKRAGEGAERSHAQVSSYLRSVMHANDERAPSPEVTPARPEDFAAIAALNV